MSAIRILGGGSGVEQAVEPQPADHAAPHPLGERGQISLGDRPHRQEHRWGVARGPISSRRENAVGRTHVQEIAHCRTGTSGMT